ncbi:MAG: Asp-tRNA(Asn)/Glu-tRNA(Gln) amidotransferase subunit GatA [Aeropyrum sp.]|nr:Asp-tRNA(Asn)/Glu-tRNA(Gln) amidotransferase subunit GatA [Aeropyrum sp.]MCE4615558.1 Asp-tRNA(Asn)/Glu-tRNA(Gln) amidotransferase subunit GatA [Aeropyrum sp.]
MRQPTVHELLEAFRHGDTDPVENAHRVIENIARREGKINAYISLEDFDSVLEKAEDSRRRWMRGAARKLEGIIIGVKDNISTSFLPTTAGSRILDGYVPPFDATVVERLQKEGAIIIGKTNLDEFAMGSTGEFSAFGPTRNPWDEERVPGGSSSGSGACLAYGGCNAALGSDTGGSVRLPAAYTATVGLKPTYGLVSRYGLIPYGNSLEQISPMGLSSLDVALILQVMSGYDPLDATSLNVNPDVVPEGPADPESIRLCIPGSLVGMSDEPVKKSFYSLIDRLTGEGASVDTVEIEGVEKALPTYYTIAVAEAASNLARFEGTLYPSRGDYSGDYWRFISKSRGEGFGIEVKRRILMGVYVLSEGYRDEYYLAATKVRRIVRDELARITKKCFIATPASPVLPPKLGEALGDPLKLYAMDAYTVLANLSGLPALVVPSGFSSNLPTGVQFIGGKLTERSLLSLGMLVEELTGIRGAYAGG